MFFARTHDELDAIVSSVERIGNVSDNVIHFGPIRLGLEAVLEFVPLVGEVYSGLAGFMILLQGARARVPLTVLLTILTLILARTGVGAFDFVPGLGIAGDVVAGLFRAHKISADLVAKAIGRTLYVEGARRDPANAEIVAAIRSGAERRRVVFMG